MIQITLKQGEVEVIGHAGYAEHGKDIVCAGVSALTATFAGSIAELGCGCVDEEVSGLARIRYDQENSNAVLLVRFFEIGMQMISEEYPEYVALSSRVLF